MKSTNYKIGVFDSGIGGFSVLSELIKVFPEGEYYYFSDDAYAPYGPKSDEFITERTFVIADELIRVGAQMIVVACNTATATSIDALRTKYPEISFVGVEPYLNAFYKETGPSKMAVLTTESTGRSERFKRLKERLDPKGLIDHFSLTNLAHMVERLYREPGFETEFDQLLDTELLPLKNKNYTHTILGCTHYPLVKDKIERVLHTKALSPCPYVAQRVRELALKSSSLKDNPSSLASTFKFYSSSKPEWREMSRETFLLPFKK